MIPGTVAISRMERGRIDARDLFIACKICFAFIIHPYIKKCIGVGRALDWGEGGGSSCRFVLKIEHRSNCVMFQCFLVFANLD